MVNSSYQLLKSSVKEWDSSSFPSSLICYLTPYAIQKLSNYGFLHDNHDLSSPHERRNTTLLDNIGTSSDIKSCFFELNDVKFDKKNLFRLETHSVGTELYSLEYIDYEKNLKFDEKSGKIGIFLPRFVVERIDYVKKKVAGCSADSVVMSCGCKFWSFPISCGLSRVCPVCARKEYFRARNKYLPVLRQLIAGRGSAVNLRLITLTQKNVSDVREGRRNLLLWFGRLRERVFWKNKVFGDIMVIEAKLQDSGFFHVHAHVVAYGTFMPQGDLSGAWLESSGGVAKVVDVRAAGSLNGVVKYLLDYITKGANSGDECLINQASFYRQKLFITHGVFNRASNNCVMPNDEKFCCPDCNLELVYCCRESEYEEFYGSSGDYG